MSAPHWRLDAACATVGLPGAPAEPILTGMSPRHQHGAIGKAICGCWGPARRVDGARRSVARDTNSFPPRAGHHGGNPGTGIGDRPTPAPRPSFPCTLMARRMSRSCEDRISFISPDLHVEGVLEAVGRRCANRSAGFCFEVDFYAERAERGAECAEEIPPHALRSPQKSFSARSAPRSADSASKAECVWPPAIPVEQRSSLAAPPTPGIWTRPAKAQR